MPLFGVAVPTEVHDVRRVREQKLEQFVAPSCGRHDDVEPIPGQRGTDFRVDITKLIVRPECCAARRTGADEEELASSVHEYACRRTVPFPFWRS
jgi:hypothetical protein